jgi:hypothetical protein
MYKPEESAASHCRLYEEHVSVCDMAQNPVDQLAVVRDSVHAESCEGVGKIGQSIKVGRIGNSPVCAVEYCEYEDYNEEFGVE